VRANSAAVARLRKRRRATTRMRHYFAVRTLVMLPHCTARAQCQRCAAQIHHCRTQ
jgi:hypothetical protein